MLTAKDIELMKHIFLTKDDKNDLFTKKDFAEAKKDFLTKKEFMLVMADYSTKQEDADFRQEVRNDILTFKDEILTEIKDLRLETMVNSSFRSRIEKQDKRIDRLESAVFN